MPIKVLLVDDSPFILSTLVDFLTQHHQVSVAGTAAGGHEGLAMTEELAPDVVTVDLSMPDLDGIEVIRRLRDKSPDLGLVALTSLAPEDHEDEVMQAGADGFVDKGAVIEELMPAIIAAATKHGRWKDDKAADEVTVSDTARFFLD